MSEKSLIDKIKQMTSINKEEFENWVDAGEHTDQDTIDLHEAVLFLSSEVERLKSALHEIDNSYDFDGNAAYAMQQIAEKALKEPTPE